MVPGNEATGRGESLVRVKSKITLRTRCLYRTFKLSEGG